MKLNPNQTIWLFDLDNTLHNASKAVFPAIAENMTRYMAQVLADENGQVDMERVNHLRTEYLRRYGATLQGMIIHHGVKQEEFLREAHRFDNLTQLLHLDRGVARVLRRLPGKKILFTNAPHAYSREVLQHLRLHRDFAGHIAIEQMRVHGKAHPKPSKAYLRKLLAQHGWQARQCILVEDSVANLQAAKRLGLRTVMITGHGQHVVQKSRTACADITVKSVFQLARLFKSW
ncbi:pyrimidine 5'-nucleotidase [Undibacterium cyanobacteriorum]|uniref:Pyrimidine 5'-nucleotidase n=1 Tax=Undibacterium cyanobacteriorum TaxID=3073561 RepID=A0ABY9RJU2_9BURK|nr:pyrimidine 5'-nucleotidase [Undibacterium sp. 20NA77.5]WMW81109.1 pyrimidine 5'-nucleotidase [Undibacterium sp. 20NA77.5]